MPSFAVPVPITYNTEGVTPLADVITSLIAAEHIIREAVAILPSLSDGDDIQLVSLSLKSLSQESPLKEWFVAGILLAIQQPLQNSVVDATEQITGQDIPSEYGLLLTLVVIVSVLYGAGLANDILRGALAEGPAKHKLDALVADLAKHTGKEKREIERILDAKYSKPGPVKELIKHSLNFFLPSKREGRAEIIIGHERIEPRIVEDVPYANQLGDSDAFSRFKPIENVELELHAQDMDRTSTGWAAVPNGICDKRLRLKLMPPVEAKDVWGKSSVVGDIVLISKATANGFEPSEIHLISIR